MVKSLDWTMIRSAALVAITENTILESYHPCEVTTTHSNSNTFFLKLYGEADILKEQGQYHGSWCPDSLCHQVIHSHSIGYVKWGMISINP